MIYMEKKMTDIVEKLCKLRVGLSSAQEEVVQKSIDEIVRLRGHVEALEEERKASELAKKMPEDGFA